MKKTFLTLFLLYPLFTLAQFSDYYNYYLYIARGETVESSNNGIYYAHFDDEESLYCSTISKSTLKSKYNGGVIDEYAINLSHNCKYDSNTSTYKYEVYVEKTYSQQTLWGSNLPAYDPYTGQPLTYHSGYRYYAFSLDRSEMITWTCDKSDNTPRNKKYYKLVKIEDLVPPTNTNNYDFLR
jgi:hypothetical protein